MMVIYLLAERLGASRLAGAGVAVLVGTGSATITSAATMGPDTATAVTSGLVLLAALSYDGTRRRAGWFLLAVAIAALTKLTAFEAVGAALIYLVLLPLLARRRATGDDASVTASRNAAPSATHARFAAHRGRRLGDVPAWCRSCGDFASA